MRLTLADWVVVALYFLYYKSRASQNTAEFFLSGRNVPWWLAGTSMVATTFAADTPLVVTGLVAQNGIAGNWLWWNLLASGMLTVFFYARLWRRSGVMTDIEFGDPLRRPTGRLPARLPGHLPGLAHQLHHPRLGQPRDGEDPAAGLRRVEGRRAVDRRRHDRPYVRDLDALRIMGRAGDRPVPVRDQDGHGDRAGRRRRAGGRGNRGDAGQAGGHRSAARGHDRRSGIRAELCARRRLGLDADDHLLCVHRRQLVGHLVSGCRARRRRLRGAADVERERRKELVARYPVVQHRALCHPALALDPRRPRLADLVSQPQGPGDRIRPGDDRLSAIVVARTHGRGVRRGLHVDDRHPAELGCELSRERFLPPLRAP